MGEGFFELAVHAQAFEGRGLAAQRLAEGERADRAGLHRAYLVDDQVRIGGGGPPTAAVFEPFDQQLMGEIVEWPSPAGDGEPRVAEVYIAQAYGADRASAGGMNGG